MIKKMIKKYARIYCYLREFLMFVRKFRRGWGGVSSKAWVVSRQRYISSDFVVGDFGFVGRDCTIYPKVNAGRFLLMAPEVSVLGGIMSFERSELPCVFQGEKLFLKLI